MSLQRGVTASALAVCACAILFGSVQSARAVIIASGDGSGNTTAPVDDPGFNNVGRPSTTSGVYLGMNGSGEHWVISAWHSGAVGLDGDITGQNFTFPTSGTPYTVLEVVRLQNPDTSLADLKVFRVSGAPGGLNNLTISENTPTVGAEVTMVGVGRRREVSETFWLDDLVNNSGTWPETSEGLSNRAGYKWTASGLTHRWGTNEVEDLNGVFPGILFEIPDFGFGTAVGYGTTFDDGLPTTHEAQAATGDSGGAVFVKNGGNWELSGIMLQRTLFNDQPIPTSVYGNSSYIADLSIYRSQIVSITGVPEPSGMVLGGLGVAGLLLAGWRRWRR